MASPTSGTPLSSRRPEVARILSFSPTRPPSRGPSYSGLGPGEAGEDGPLEEDENLTTVELRALRASAEFQRFMRSRHLSAASLERNAARLRLYRQLKELDPDGFRRLVAANPRSFRDEVPGAWLLGLQLVVSQLTLCLLCLLTGLAWRAGWTWARTTTLGLAWLTLGLGPWSAGKPCASVLFRSLWLTDKRWAVPAPAWRIALAAAVDTLLTLGTLGIGLLPLTWMRCRAAAHQTPGELLTRICLIREVAEPSAERVE